MTLHPTQVCRHDPCWCGTLRDPAPQRPEGQGWTQEKHDRFLETRRRDREARAALAAARQAKR